MLHGPSCFARLFILLHVCFYFGCWLVFAANSKQADWRPSARKAHFKTSTIPTVLIHHHPTGPSSLLPVLCCKSLSLEVRPTVNHPAQPVIG